MHHQSKSLSFVQTLLQTCFIYELKKIYDHNVGKFRTYFLIKNAQKLGKTWGGAILQRIPRIYVEGRAA